jgi:hypothetical protein
VDGATELGQRTGNADGLVDARGQQHQRGAIEDELLIETEPAHQAQEICRMLLPRADDHGAGVKRNLLLAQGREEQLGRRLGDPNGLVAPRQTYDGAVLGDDGVEGSQVDVRNREVLQHASGDQQGRDTALAGGTERFGDLGRQTPVYRASPVEVARKDPAVHAVARSKPPAKERSRPNAGVSHGWASAPRDSDG